MTDSPHQRSEWTVLWRERGALDPDYPSPPSVITLWEDNLGGLMLGMERGDGENVIILPLPDDRLDDLGKSIRWHQKRTVGNDPEEECTPWVPCVEGTGTVCADGRQGLPECSRGVCDRTTSADPQVKP